MKVAVMIATSLFIFYVINQPSSKKHLLNFLYSVIVVVYGAIVGLFEDDNNTNNHVNTVHNGMVEDDDELL